MLLLGLTGSIGMGKSATAQMFARHGVPVYDADATIHALYEPGGAAVALLEPHFPDAVVNGGIDRSVLSKHVVGVPEQMKKLESIVHPLAGKVQAEFLLTQFEAGVKRVLLDIPLLFESGAEGRFDKVVVVSAPFEVQRARVLDRPDMSEEKFKAILAKQMADADKRAKADFIIETDKGFEHAEAEVKKILGALDGLRGEKFDADAVRGMIEALEAHLKGQA